MCARMSVYALVCMWVHEYVRVCVCIYVCMCMHVCECLSISGSVLLYFIDLIIVTYYWNILVDKFSYFQEKVSLLE